MSSTTGFTSNFSHSYSVVLQHPISDVFPILGTAKGHEQVCRLSSLCSNFELFEPDHVQLEHGGNYLGETNVRSKAPADNDEAPASEFRKILPRQPFTMTESVPLLFGMYKANIVLNGTLTWDSEFHTTLYETESNSGVKVWKLRTFEEVAARDVNGGNATLVSERIEGVCPRYLKIIVQKETSKGHIAHMDAYHTLFE
ncbi:hypothetical protein D9757_002536 [Collybiopsis confluens]|uniref:Uncharacterized protein n=1 Tax=Collybiopsis confluens TaxID=2823264 RepID=A0A8H5HXZ3_9AGAR|nr:hypothetical protein D9757_002536 [Collybiopsis confluens]